MDQAINFTSLLPKEEITQDCFNWCKDQHFIHQNNLGVEGMMIPLFAGFVILAYLVLRHHDAEDKHLQRIIYLLPEFALYIIIGFFVWYFLR